MFIPGICSGGVGPGCDAGVDVVGCVAGMFIPGMCSGGVGLGCDAGVDVVGCVAGVFIPGMAGMLGFFTNRCFFVAALFFLRTNFGVGFCFALALGICIPGISWPSCWEKTLCLTENARTNAADMTMPVYFGNKLLTDAPCLITGAGASRKGFHE